MKNSLKIFGVGLFLAAVSLVVLAKSQAEGPDPRAEQDLSPLMQEIYDELRAEQSALAELQDRLAAAPDEHAYLMVVREIEQRKLASEMRILELQAAHSREQDRPHEAQAIEAALKAMRSAVSGKAAHSEPSAPASSPTQN